MNKKKKSMLTGCLFDRSLKQIIQKQVVTALIANCLSVNIL